MTFSLKPAASFADRRLAAEQDFEHAQQIAVGGERAARDYALAHFEQLAPQRWAEMNDTKRQEHLAVVAKGALGCARNIVRDGRAHYIKQIDGQPWQVVCTLSADATAGPVGYQLWDRAQVH